MVAMFAGFPEPDDLVCTVAYILIIGLFSRRNVDGEEGKKPVRCV
jgi:hypothetical protein